MQTNVYLQVFLYLQNIIFRLLKKIEFVKIIKRCRKLHKFYKNKYFNYLYFSTIAIDKNHRDIHTLRELINITSKKILEIVNLGCEIKEVMADCSTPQGQKITQRFLKLKPFMKTSHNSMIHILSGDEFIKLLDK